VVDDLMSAAEVCERLNITLNNLRQIQHRKTLTWVQKSGRNVFYTKADVENYFSKRQERNQG
jgi:predicted site-specific integrase-resolvase